MSEWDRSKRESQEAFHAFTIYRDMGPRKRSHVAVATELDCNINLIHRWSTEHNWVQRSVAWDDHIDKIQQETLEDEARTRVTRILQMSDAYLGLVGQKLKTQLEAIQNNRPVNDPIPINMPSFVAVSRLITELSGIPVGAGLDGEGNAILGQKTSALTAEDLVQATMKLARDGAVDVSPREVVLQALGEKYGRERLGLPKPIEPIEVEFEDDGHQAEGVE